MQDPADCACELCRHVNGRYSSLHEMYKKWLSDQETDSNMATYDEYQEDKRRQAEHKKRMENEAAEKVKADRQTIAFMFGMPPANHPISSEMSARSIKDVPPKRINPPDNWYGRY